MNWIQFSYKIKKMKTSLAGSNQRFAKSNITVQRATPKHFLAPASRTKSWWPSHSPHHLSLKWAHCLWTWKFCSQLDKQALTDHFQAMLFSSLNDQGVANIAMKQWVLTLHICLAEMVLSLGFSLLSSLWHPLPLRRPRQLPQTPWDAFCYHWSYGNWEVQDWASHRDKQWAFLSAKYLAHRSQ